MTFKELFDYSQRIKAEPSRNGKVALISNYLQQLTSQEALYGVHYISGHIPQGRMNLAWKGLAELRDVDCQGTKPLQIDALHNVLKQVKKARGKKKYEILKPVFTILDKEQRDYLLALIFGEAQQGAGEGVVKKALAQTFNLSDKDLEEAYLHNPDLGKLFLVLKRKGSQAIKEIAIQLFKPVKPMLAQVSESIEDALTELQDAAVEYKLDGVRIQVHRDKDEVRIFSRNLKDRTINFPELVTIIKTLPIERFIMDGEAIALDNKGQIVPFQILAKRTTRIKDIEEMMKDVPVMPKFFDILYIDHDDLTLLPYAKRYALLSDILSDPVYRVQHELVTNKDAASRFFDQAVNNGHEGIVIKGLQSPYRPGKRGKHWFKIKRTYTIDCAVLAAEWGYGRRTGWLSNIHLGVLDETRTKYLMVGKTFKGLTDKMLQWITDTLPQHKVHEDKWTVYVQPVIVAEIMFNEVQQSSRYDSGVSLRFARVKQFRNDKDAKDVNTIIDLERIANAQRPA